MTKTARTAVNDAKAYRNADVINAIQAENMTLLGSIDWADLFGGLFGGLF